MIAQRRGKNVAIIGAVLQFVFTAVMIVIWRLTDSLAAMSSLMLLGGGVGLWLMVAVLFYCRQLERREAVEIEEIAAGGRTDGRMFEETEGGELRPAANRLVWMERWIVSIFTLLWAAYHISVGLLMLRYLAGQGGGEPANPAIGVLVTLIIAFVAFLFSRYATGMSRLAQWRLLRAAGSYLLVSVLFLAGVGGGLLAAWQGYPIVDLCVAYAVPAVALILSVELLLNFILDFYRPRLPGQEHRYSFDSRLFSLIADPGRVGHSIAEAVNYQFGFEVSKSWFYQLLSKALVPLIVFGVAVLLAMSCVVIVADGERYVVMHWGKVTGETLGPGMHFKRPWPIDTIERFNVAAVHEIVLGAGEHREPPRVGKRELLLWTQEHGHREELDFLVAISPRGAGQAAGKTAKTLSVNVIKLVVPVHYVITDVDSYGFKFVDAAKVLECLAYREMVRYCASATLDSHVVGGQDRPEAIMTFGRERAAEELKRRIQAEADKAGLGVRITHVGLKVHPPAEAAPAFEKVLEAERRQDEMRYKAEAQANEMLAGVAGDPVAALKLALAIRTVEELDGLKDIEEADEADEAELVRRLDQYVRHAREDLKALDEEIRRDRLLGKLRRGEKTPKELLREAHAVHLALLEQIESAPSAFDYDGQIAQALARADRQFDETSAGLPAELVAKARGYRWKKELAEQSRYDSFHRELMAYQASPQVYMQDRWLDVWDGILPEIKKYVLGVDPDKCEFWLNWEQEPGAMRGAFQGPSGGK